MKRRHFNEKGEEPQSLSIDLAKKILRDQKYDYLKSVYDGFDYKMLQQKIYNNIKIS